MIRIIKRIAKATIAVSAFVGVVAGILDLLGTDKNGKHKPYGPYEKYCKRPLDAFLSTGALIVFSPILLVIGLLVKTKLGSPVFFTQNRPGKDGKIFKLYKFRSMTNEKDEKGNLLPDKDRLNKYGRIIRATSLDELPSLINIIKGDISIVGPRPLAVKYLPYYTKEERHRHDVRPGLTGKAQVNGRNNLSWDDKFAYDLEYVDNISFVGDMMIILKTVKKVFIHEGIGQGEKMPVNLFDERNNWLLNEDGARRPEGI